jgi:GST-like protein
MIDFYFHPTPNPAKVALMLEETGLEYELRPVDTKKGQQHLDAFLNVNPNGKVRNRRQGRARREGSEGV